MGYRSDVFGGLQLPGARYYDPAVGRFLTPDPIGFTGGLNFYACTENNPDCEEEVRMRFYVMKKPAPDSPEDRLGRSDALRTADARTGDAVHCPRCGRALTLLEWLPPHRMELESWGAHFADVADIRDYLVVSERFRRLFEEAGLRGLTRFDPIEVTRVIYRRRPKEPVSHYYHAPVIRSRTTIDQQASGFVWSDPASVCPECLTDGLLKRWARLVVREETWDGEDVFEPRGGAGVMVTERFRQWFEEHHLYGAVFVPAEEYGHDFYPSETAAEQRGN